MFSKLLVTINNPSYSSEFVVSENELELSFNTDDVKCFKCEFSPLEHSREIQIGLIILHLGSERCATLRFLGTGSDSGFGDNTCPELQHFR